MDRRFAPHTPTIGLVNHRLNDCGSRCNRLLESGVWIRDDHYHSDRTTAKRLGAEIQVFWRFIRQPKSGLGCRKISRYGEKNFI
jgi:hypothetical protein